MVDTHHERSQTLVPVLARRLTMSAFIAAKTARDALFFEGSDGLS